MQAKITDLRAALNRAEQLEIHRCDHIAILKKNCDEMESKLAALAAQEPCGYDPLSDSYLYKAAGAAPDLVKLITQLHKAKNRYHTQLAACDLFDACGLKNERPTK